MKKLIMWFLLFSVSSSIFAQVKGTLEEKDGKKVLTVWGTHQERGYAHGYLMAESVKSVFDNYLVNHLCMGIPFYYLYMRSLFVGNFAIEDKYQTEAEALIQGMIDAGVNLYNQTLNKNIDATDILACSALPDLTQMVFSTQERRLACSSISSWGPSTQQDPTLAGHLVFTRLMDWSNDESVCDHHLLIVNMPWEEGEQKWVSMAFAGFLGALSGINESGVGAFLNLGNHTAYETGDPFYPILFTVRNGIEADDYNQDLDNSPADIVQAVQDRNRSGGFIIHLVKDEGADSAPILIECNNENGVIVRDMSNNTSVPGVHLVATNHFRTLYAPEACDRYAGIVNELNNSTDMSPGRSWDILENAACLPNNLQAMQYIPSSNQLKWATSTTAVLAYAQDPTVFDLEALLNLDNDPPSVAGIPDVGFNEDESFSIDLDQYGTDIDNDTTELTWTAEVLENGTLMKTFRLQNDLTVTIDTETHVATFSAAADYFGSDIGVVFTVTDPGAFSDNDTMTVDVLAVNDAPRFVLPLPPIELVQGQHYGIAKTDLYVLVEDVDDPDSTLIWDAEDDDHFDPTVTADSILIDAPTDWFGTDTLVMIVSDGELIDSAPLVIVVDQAGTDVRLINTIPKRFELCQNYPNPFNSSTVIRFRIPISSHVTLKVYDCLGKEVTTIVNEKLTAGEYKFIWNAQSLSNGAYLYRLEAETFFVTKKLILQK